MRKKTRFLVYKKMTRIDVNQNTNSCQKKKVVLTVPKTDGEESNMQKGREGEGEGEGEGERRRRNRRSDENQVSLRHMAKMEPVGEKIAVASYH